MTSSCKRDTDTSLSALPIDFRFEAGPLRIQRMAVYPYPDLKRLWIRIQLSSFVEPPNIRLCCLDSEGAEVSDMLLVEWRDPYISLTMHMRSHEPGADYVLRAEVARDEQLVTTQDFPFQLVFQEPEDGEG